MNVNIGRLWVITIIIFFIALVIGLVHIVYVSNELYVPPAPFDYQSEQLDFNIESQRRLIQKESGDQALLKAYPLKVGMNRLAVVFQSPSTPVTLSDTMEISIYRQDIHSYDKQFRITPLNDSLFVVNTRFEIPGQWFIRTELNRPEYRFRKEFTFTILAE